MSLPIPYIAGFFDGEGSIGIYRNGHATPNLHTVLTQNRHSTSLCVFSDLEKSFDGFVTEQRTSHGIKLSWQLSSHRASRFIGVIYPNLILKREQAALAMWWQQRRPLRHARDERGRITPYPREVTRLDLAAEQVMKLLKKSPLLQLNLDDSTGAELVEVVQILTRELSQQGPSNSFTDSAEITRRPPTASGCPLS